MSAHKYLENMFLCENKVAALVLVRRFEEVVKAIVSIADDADYQLAKQVFLRQYNHQYVQRIATDAFFDGQVLSIFGSCMLG